MKKLMLFCASIAILASDAAWCATRVKDGCGPIAALYEKQALKSFKFAESIQGWLEKRDYASLCSFYTREYPEWQASYIGDITKLKAKGVCWDKSDQASLERNQASAREGLGLQKEYCDKSGTK